MNGRRQHPRFLLTTPLVGVFRMREEVVIEGWKGSELVVSSPFPCRPGEQMSLEFPGDARSRLVRVEESRPVVGEDGAVRHSIRLLFLSPAAGASAGGGRTSK